MRNVLVTLTLSFGLVGLAKAETVYFVVSEARPVTPGESYVLPLEDEADIAHARNLIASGPSIGLTIAVAEIAAGSDGINRNVLAPGQPLWSWHVERFEGFTDSTAEILDGNPAFVEEDVDAWIANTGGLIGFWNYTVTAELHAIPVPGAFGLLLSAIPVLTLAIRRSTRRHSRCASVHKEPSLHGFAEFAVRS